MAASVGSALHRNQPLTEYAISWRPPQKNFFMRGELFPRLDVSKDSNIVRSIDMGRMMEIYDAEAGPGGFVKEISFGIGNDTTYKCQPYALEGIINYYERDQADSVLQYEKMQTAMPLRSMAFKLEKKAMDYARTAANYGGNTKTLAANELWDAYDATSSNPIDELIAALEKVLLDIGMKCNRLVFDKMVWRVIRRHPALLQAAPVHTTPAGLQVITVEGLEKILGEWLEPGSIRVSVGRYNLNPDPNPGNYPTTVVPKKSYIGADVIMAYVEPPNPESMGFAHEFAFSGLDGNDPMVVYEFEDPKIAPKGGMRVRVMCSADYRIMRPASGYILKGVVDTTQAQYGSQL